MNRLELQRRLSSTNLQYRIIPTVGQDVNTIVDIVRSFAPNGAVEVVSYMLSLSFFFDSPESSASVVRLVSQTLMYGGYFMALSIDGRYVLEFFGNERYYNEENGTKKGNFQLIDFELRLQNPTLPEIYIDIPDSIVTQQIEYLTNLPGLQEKFKENGLDLLLEERVDKEKFMTLEELIFTRFFTKFVMKRRSRRQ